MPESPNQPETTSPDANAKKSDPEMEGEETNFLKPSEKVLNIVCAIFTNQELWRILVVPISTYLSFFIIISITFLLFKPSNISLQNTNETNQSLTKEQKKQIAEEVNMLIATQQKKSSQQKAFSETPNSILAKGYIDGQIKQEAQEQAEKVAKDEIDKLKADWKGDLFGQISFPVIFAIASIFAAFAVKDILTEILKKEEKEEVKQELEQELRNQVVPEAIKHNQVEINKHIDEIETYTYWLEHELIGIMLAQITDDSKSELLVNLKEAEEKNIWAIEKLFYRANTTLNKVSSRLLGTDLNLIREAEYIDLKSRIKGIGLSESSQEILLDKLDKSHQIASGAKDEQLLPEYSYERIDNIAEMQIRLLVAKLSKPLENETTADKLEKQEMIAFIMNYLSRDSRHQANERFKRFHENLPPLRPRRRQ